MGEGQQGAILRMGSGGGWGERPSSSSKKSQRKKHGKESKSEDADNNQA
jgi:hypothetical protein